MAYSRVALQRICWLFGITRQAYYQHFDHQQELSIEEELIVQQVKSIRALHPVSGGRKLYVMLQPFMLEHQIKMGRDAIFDVLAANKLLVKRRKRSVVTTWSSHWLHKYPNLIKDYRPTSSNQLWVSDITYWRLKTGFVYISLITDAYSRKVVGYNVSENLKSLSPVQALEMAIKENAGSAQSAIHHSDRGVQYCSADYVKLLQDNGIRISMTENGDPLENAVAERMNGIIKGEYLEHYPVNNIGEAATYLDKAVHLYNNERPHMSIGWLTPQKVHNSTITATQEWKSYYRKKEEEVIMS